MAKIAVPKLRFFVLTAVIAAVLIAFNSDKFVFRLPEHKIEKIKKRLADQLQKEKVTCALSFDGPFMRDEAHNVQVEAEHCVSVDGVRGDARRFKGDEDAIINTASRWSKLGASYSCCLRMRFAENSPDSQEICFTANPSPPVGWSLVNGAIRFSFPTANGSGAFVEAPVTDREKWHSFVVTIDAGTSSAKLFIDGVLRTSTRVMPSVPAHSPIIFGNPQWHPLHADLDEAAFWARVLSDAEVAKISKLDWTLLQDVAPFSCAQLSFWTWMRGALPAAVRSAERVYPSHVFKNVVPDAPALDILLSKHDLRHFARVHEEAMRSGGRTDSGAKLRKCSFITAKSRTAGTLALDNPYIYPQRVDRPAFIAVTDLDGDGIDEHLRLYPPEDFTLLHPGYGPPLSMFAQSYVRLSLSGDPLGLYCIDVFRHNGEAWVLDMTFFNPASPLRQNPRRVFDVWDLMSMDERAERRDLILADILADPRSKWSRREWMNTREAQIAALATKDLPLPFPTAQNALGNNAAPFYITEDLFLSDPTLQMVTKWKSSRPDIIDPEGRVHRPSGDVPVRVTLHGFGKKGEEVATLEFRVMPEKPRLPAIMLYLAIPPTKHRRSDFTAEFYPAGGAPHKFLTGFAGNGSGIKPRGNTSYVKGAKKPLSLKFDEPHGIFGPEEDRGLYLLGGYSDTTRLRTRIGYETFKAMGETSIGHHEAPSIGWIEVFVNNDYYGIFEMCSRPKPTIFADYASPSLFKIKFPTPLFQEVSQRAFVQEFPNIEKVCSDEEVMRFMRIATEKDSIAFADGMEREADLSNILDFSLLVNFTGNADGRVTNFILGHEDTGGKKYFFVPWDYDKTFRPEINLQFHGNALTLRLMSEIPGFKEQLANRWRELRSGVLSDENFFQKLDGEAEFLAPYMPFEYEILSQPDLDYCAEVNTLKQEVSRHFKWMDNWAESLRKQ